MNCISVTALFLFNETHDPSQANGRDVMRLETKPQFPRRYGGYESGVACGLASCCKEKTPEQ